MGILIEQPPCAIAPTSDTFHNRPRHIQQEAVLPPAKLELTQWDGSGARSAMAICTVDGEACGNLDGDSMLCTSAAGQPRSEALAPLG